MTETVPTPTATELAALLDAIEHDGTVNENFLAEGYVPNAVLFALQRKGWAARRDPDTLKIAVTTAGRVAAGRLCASCEHEHAEVDPCVLPDDEPYDWGR
jgi:hypothetical protein